MEPMNHAQLYLAGITLGMTIWFLSLGYSKVINLYKTLTT